MLRGLSLISVAVLAVAAVARTEDPDTALVLVGKPYAQYQQVSTAFTQEWKRATGKEPVVLPFPNDEAQRGQLLKNRPGVVVCLGETPAAWAVQRPEDFSLGFTMVVEPTRLKRMREESPMKSRNLTGVSIDVGLEEQVAAVVRLMPNVKRIGVLTQDPALRDQVASIRAICDAQHLTLLHVELTKTGELPPRLDQMLGQIDLLWSLPDPQVFQAQLAQHIIGQCAARGVPLVGLSATFVKNGATLSFERDYEEIGRLLAQQCLRQLKQSDPDTNWHVEAPRQIVVSINQRSFEALGLKTSNIGSELKVAKY